MYNRSPGRSHRSKGFKVKHILQICVLIVVCFWLIYQVKRSHEKKKEFDEKDVKLASETQNGGEILRLGRKDISRVTEIGEDGKLHGEDDEENEADEEENKRDNEQEREANRAEDRLEKDSGKGDDDDEVDNREEEKTGDGNQEEEFVDEEKEKKEGDEIDEDNEDERKDDNENAEKEGNENAEKEDNEDGEKEDSEDGEKEDNKEGTDVLEDQDDGATRNTHEAREEQYKADDASSEVTHDAKIVIPENATNRHTVGNFELSSDGKENLGQSSSHTVPEENSHELTNGNISSKTSSSLKESSDQPLNTTPALNATSEYIHDEGSHTPGILFLQTNTSGSVSDRNQLATKTQHVNTTSQGSLANNITGTTGTKADDMSSVDTGAEDGTDGNSESNGTAEENEFSISESETDNQSDPNDHADEFDSSLTQEEKDYRTDLGTLPDIRVEAQSAEDAEAE